MRSKKQVDSASTTEMQFVDLRLGARALYRLPHHLMIKDSADEYVTQVKADVITLMH
jgi:hypothetical protein